MDFVVGAIECVKGAFGEGLLETGTTFFFTLAQLGVITQFGLGPDAFRVAAPLATQRTAFEEDRGSCSRTVVTTVPLDVQDSARYGLGLGRLAHD